MIRALRNKFFPFLFAIPLFFCVHHYNGIIIDATLYITQYVHSIDPARFLRDPAFEFGNQGDLGCFSTLFGWFLESFGVDKGAFVYTLLMQFLWIFFAVCLIRVIVRILQNRLWTLPITILFVGIFAHGMQFAHIRFFQYVEPYACSRSLSVVMGIAALALLLQQKKIASLLMISIGMAIHPITAGWCLPVWMIYFFPKTRFLIGVISLILPLCGFLHVGRFDFFPDDWLLRPLNFAPCYESIGRFGVLFAFFMFVVRRFTTNKQMLNVSIALSFLLVIAFYWDVCGGYGKNVFLYQVQPWRALWIASIIAVPMGLSFIKDSIRKIVKRKQMSSYDLALFLIFASFLMPINLMTITVVSAILLARKRRVVTIWGVDVIFCIFVVVGIIVQQYHGWCLRGYPSFWGYDFYKIWKIRDSVLLYQFLLSIYLIVFFTCKKKYVSAALLLLYLFCPNFLIMPFLSLYFALAPQKNKRWFILGVVAIALITLIDGLAEMETRFFKITNGMPVKFPWICFSTVISLGLILLPRKIRGIFICVWLLFCCAFAVSKYDNRSDEKKAAESQLNAYLHNTLFPQIPERGKALFVVSGIYANEPRLRFLTGSYFTNCGHSGEIFDKNHYKTVLKRGGMLFSGKLDSFGEYVEYDKIMEKLADKDTLINRVQLLCAFGEISHVVTDVTTLPFTKEDSIIIANNQKVYLYGCLPIR